MGLQCLPDHHPKSFVRTFSAKEPRQPNGPRSQKYRVQYIDVEDTPTRTTIHRPSYSLPMQHHTNSEIRRDQLDNDSITVSSDDKSKLLNEHIKDVHFAYKVEIARYKKEIRELKEKDNNNASKKKSKIDLANEQFQHEQHVAKLRNQWMAAEEITQRFSK